MSAVAPVLYFYRCRVPKESGYPPNGQHGYLTYPCSIGSRRSGGLESFPQLCCAFFATDFNGVSTQRDGDRVVIQFPITCRARISTHDYVLNGPDIRVRLFSQAPAGDAVRIFSDLTHASVGAVPPAEIRLAYGRKSSGMTH